MESNTSNNTPSLVLSICALNNSRGLKLEQKLELLRKFRLPFIINTNREQNICISDFHGATGVYDKYMLAKKLYEHLSIISTVSQDQFMIDMAKMGIPVAFDGEKIVEIPQPLFSLNNSILDKRKNPELPPKLSYKVPEHSAKKQRVLPNVLTLPEEKEIEPSSDISSNDSSHAQAHTQAQAHPHPQAQPHQQAQTQVHQQARTQVHPQAQAQEKVRPKPKILLKKSDQKEKTIVFLALNARKGTHYRNPIEELAKLMKQKPSLQDYKFMVNYTERKIVNGNNSVSCKYGNEKIPSNYKKYVTIEFIDSSSNCMPSPESYISLQFNYSSGRFIDITETDLEKLEKLFLMTLEDSKKLSPKTILSATTLMSMNKL